jgi:hypothetical protein
MSAIYPAELKKTGNQQKGLNWMTGAILQGIKGSFANDTC